MRALLGLFQIKFGAPADHLALKIEVFLHHFLERHNLGYALVQRKHNHADRILQLCKAVQLIEHHLRVCLALYLDHHAHALAVRFVVQIGDALNALFLHKIGDILDHARLVHHIRDLGNDDLEAPVRFFLDCRAAAQRNLAAACGVSRPNAAAPHNHTARGEIRTLDMLHQAAQLDLRIMDQRHQPVDHLAQVVRRNICRHAHSDAVRAVD